MPKRMPRSTSILVKLLAGLTLTCMLAGCERMAVFECAQGKDWATEQLGLATPAPMPFDTSKLDVQAIAPLFNDGVPVIAALVSGRYKDAQNYFDEVNRRASFEQRCLGLWAVEGLIRKKSVYLLPFLKSWLAAHPESKAAQLMLAIAYEEASMQAHGRGYARVTTKEQWAFYIERLSLAMPLLEILAKNDDAYGLTARNALSHSYFMTGQSDAGWKVLDEHMTKMPLMGYGYINALEYAHPKWSGQRSDERSKHVLAMADKNGLSDQRRKLLVQVIDSHRNDIEASGDPKAWRPYWTARVAEVPGEFNLSRLMRKETYVQNWTAVLDVSRRITALSPSHEEARYSTAYALQQLGKNDEAFSAMVTAAVAGSDAAMGQIVYAYVKGTLGRTQRDFDTMYEYCKFGAAIALPSAANCMASAYTDGFGGVKRDDKQAVQWHLMAARGGEINSMHDLGVLLPRVVPGLDGQMAADYWMRKAADAKHIYALKKVKAPVPSDQGVGCMIGNKAAELGDLLIKIHAFFH